MTDTILRAATEADRDFVDTLTREVMFPYVSQTWQNHKEQEKYFHLNAFDIQDTWIIQLDGEDVGRLTLLENEDGYYLKAIHLIGAAQGQGIGKRLLMKVIEESEKKGKILSLTVLRVNPAKKLYEKLGFKVYDERDHRYYMKREPSLSSEQ